MVLTSVQLSESDYKFCKDNQLKFSDLLRQAIVRQKELIEGIITDNVEEERRKRETFQNIAIELRKELEILKEENNKLNGIQ